MSENKRSEGTESRPGNRPDQIEKGWSLVDSTEPPAANDTMPPDPPPPAAVENSPEAGQGTTEN
jgi:hypothetical protein